MKQWTRSRWLCALAAAALLILAVWVYFADALTGEETAMLISSHKAGVGQLTPDSPVQQTFRNEREGLKAVEAMFSNYNKKVREGTLTLWLTDSEGTEIARQDYPVADLKNSAFVTLPLAEAAGRGTYTLHASATCTEQKGVTLRMGPVESPAEGQTLTLADGSVTGDSALNLRLRYQTVQYSMMGAGTLGLLALCLSACVPLAGGKEKRHG